MDFYCLGDNIASFLSVLSVIWTKTNFMHQVWIYFSLQIHNRTVVYLLCLGYTTAGPLSSAFVDRCAPAGSQVKSFHLLRKERITSKLAHSTNLIDQVEIFQNHYKTLFSSLTKFVRRRIRYMSST